MELQLLQQLTAAVPGLALILSGLGGLLVIGQVVVVLTPTKADDAAWDKIKSLPILGQILAALVEFAPIQKK